MTEEEHRAEQISALVLRVNRLENRLTDLTNRFATFCDASQIQHRALICLAEDTHSAWTFFTKSHLG